MASETSPGRSPTYTRRGCCSTADTRMVCSPKQKPPSNTRSVVGRLVDESHMDGSQELHRAELTVVERLHQTREDIGSTNTRVGTIGTVDRVPTNYWNTKSLAPYPV